MVSALKDITPHNFVVTRADRERVTGTRGVVLWLTGLPASGKSSIADALSSQLLQHGVANYVLDGDTVRATLSRDLGFSPEDRAENVRRTACMAQVLMDAGLVVIVALVSPFRADRNMARAMFARHEFFEVFVDTPLEICISRDPKGLYARAAAGTNAAMTGVGQAYEAPDNPEIHLDGRDTLLQSVERLFQFLLGRQLGFDT
jgi:bifunctional enzyme CysN/CysC